MMGSYNELETQRHHFGIQGMGGHGQELVGDSLHYRVRRVILERKMRKMDSPRGQMRDSVV